MCESNTPGPALPTPTGFEVPTRNNLTLPHNLKHFLKNSLIYMPHSTNNTLCLITEILQNAHYPMLVNYAGNVGAM